jgi:hypothetical protein
MTAPAKPPKRPHLLTDQVRDLYAQVATLLARIDALERAQPAPLLKRLRKAKPE